MRVAYADPPYPGMARFYEDHPDFAGEVDHALLLDDLAGYDAWVLHTASTTLAQVLALCPGEGVRVGSWVKTFASFKNSVRVAYAWEPVIFFGGRRGRRRGEESMTDWIACHPGTGVGGGLGLKGAKPEAVCRWAFRFLGMEPDDELADLFPGAGCVARAWDAHRTAPTLMRLDFTGDGAKAESTEQMELDG